MCISEEPIHFSLERARCHVVHIGLERLLVRLRCWMPTNGRVRDRRPSGVRVVRHDGSTLRPTPAVNLSLPAPHAPTPTSCRIALRPLGMPSNDPCRSSASCPCPPADGIRLLDPPAGQEAPPFAGRRPQQRPSGRSSNFVLYAVCGPRRARSPSTFELGSSLTHGECLGH